MPGVVLNEKEIRGNFKEDRMLELANFEIRKKRKLEKTRGKIRLFSCIERGIEVIWTPVNFITLSSSHLAQIKETHP